MENNQKRIEKQKPQSIWINFLKKKQKAGKDFWKEKYKEKNSKSLARKHKNKFSFIKINEKEKSCINGIGRNKSIKGDKAKTNELKEIWTKAGTNKHLLSEKLKGNSKEGNK